MRWSLLCLSLLVAVVAGSGTRGTPSLLAVREGAVRTLAGTRNAQRASASAQFTLARSRLGRAMAERRVAAGMGTGTDLRFDVSSDPDDDVKVEPYQASSGGCKSLTRWEDKFEGKWWDFRSRFPKLAQASPGDVCNALGDMRWTQYIDGWAQPKGRNAFKKFYIDDLLAAHDMCVERLNGPSKGRFDADFYHSIHERAFKNDAEKQKKRIDFRDTDSNIILPMPVEPLGLYSNIHDKNGNIAFDTSIASISPTSYPGQYEWAYTNKPIAEIRRMVQGYLDEFESEISKLGEQDWEAKLDAVSKLHHNLENMHPFDDGVGRTDWMVLNAMMCRVGLHPVNLYNTMESAQTNWKDERDRILEGYKKWEDTYSTGASAWTMEEINRKGEECRHAKAVLDGTEPADGRVPHTQAGCFCKNVNDCKSNPLKQNTHWCDTAGQCIWTWDFCNNVVLKADYQDNQQDATEQSRRAAEQQRQRVEQARQAAEQRQRKRDEQQQHSGDQHQDDRRRQQQQQQQHEQENEKEWRRRAALEERQERQEREDDEQQRKEDNEARERAHRHPHRRREQQQQQQQQQPPRHRKSDDDLKELAELEQQDAKANPNNNLDRLNQEVAHKEQLKRWQQQQQQRGHANKPLAQIVQEEVPAPSRVSDGLPVWGEQTVNNLSQSLSRASQSLQSLDAQASANEHERQQQEELRRFHSQSRTWQQSHSAAGSDQHKMVPAKIVPRPAAAVGIHIANSNVQSETTY